MRTFTLTFNEKGEIVGGNSLSLGNLRQYSSNTYFLEIVMPSTFSATLSVNFERPDGEVASYAVPFLNNKYLIPIEGWVTDLSGEIKLTVRGVATSGQVTQISIYGLATLYCEYAVKPTDYTPSDTPSEYDYLLSLINSKVPKSTTVNNKTLNTNITLALSDLQDDVGYATDSELATAIATRVPTTRTINDKALSNNVVLTTEDIENNSGYITIDDVNLELEEYAKTEDIPTAVSELTNDSEYQTATQLATVFKGASFTYNSSDGNLSLSFTKYDNSTTTPTVINLPTELIVVDGSYDAQEEELVLTLANNQEIRIPVGALYNTYFGDNSTIEDYVDALDGNKDKFRIKATWITDTITTPLGLKLDKTGDGKDVTITFTVPTEYATPTTGESLATIIGKITKKLGELGNLAYKNTIETGDLPTGTVVDSNYVATENNFTTTLKTAYDDAVTKAHTHSNKSTLDTIEGVLTEIPATPGATEGYLATVGALRALYENPDLSWDGDADTLNGYPAHLQPDPATIPVRDVEGFINVNGVNIGNYPVTSNNVYGTLAFSLNSFVSLKVGQEELYYAKASATIAKGQVIQFAGVQGDHILVKPAVPSEINAVPDLIMGLATEDIANEEFGYITKFGYIENISTTIWGDQGAILYFDSDVNNGIGNLTQSRPSAPNTKITIAVLVKASTGQASNGRLLVRVGESVSLGKNDSDVQIGELQQDDVLTYDATLGRWENKTPLVKFGNFLINTSITFNNDFFRNRVWLTSNTSTITLTIPTTNTFFYPVGTQIVVVRNASGAVNFSPASGVTLISNDNKRAIKGINNSAVLLKYDGNTWFLLGSLE